MLHVRESDIAALTDASSKVVYIFNPYIYIFCFHGDVHIIFYLLTLMRAKVLSTRHFIAVFTAALPTVRKY